MAKLASALHWSSGKATAMRVVYNALDGSDDPANGPGQVLCDNVPPVWG